MDEQLRDVLAVSHDRELLNRAAERIVTVESHHVWIHGGRFETYSQARRDRINRVEELRRRWDEDHAKLKRLVTELRQRAA
jgi:ATPase subunit of ABC transporter with duplicated ATPase domains